MGRESISFILALEGDGSILRTPKLSSSILVLEDGFSPPVMVPPILLAKGKESGLWAPSLDSGPLRQVRSPEFSCVELQVLLLCVYPIAERPRTSLFLPYIVCLKTHVERCPVWK